MDTKTQPEADRVYEDFEPYHEWDKYDGRFTVMLPGKMLFQVFISWTHLVNKMIFSQIIYIF